MSDLLQSGHHPGADQLNAFVEHALPAHEQEQTLAHLALCPACRRIVALSLPPAAESPASLPEPTRKYCFFRWPLAWAEIPAVAALVLFIVFIRNGTTTARQTSAPTQTAATRPPASLVAPATPRIPAAVFKQVSWTAEETGVYSTGSGAAIETTGLATQALLKWGRESETVRKALNFISSKKEASGTWGTTQATIMALRALLLATQLSTDVHGSLQITLDGKPVKTLNLTSENNDLLHQFTFKGIDPHHPASIQLRFEGTGSVAYQVVGRSFVPWGQKPTAEPLSISIAYNRTKLFQNDIATETVAIRSNLAKTANMVMVDLGIPPGFDLLSEDLQSIQERTARAHTGRLEKFSLTATQAILYFNALAPHQDVALKVRLRAKYPIRAHTFQSRLYEYYDPDVNSIARPVKLEVDER